MSVTSSLISILMTLACMKSTVGQLKCQTPSSSAGHCVKLQSCESLFNILQKDWVSPDEYDLIKQSWCPATDNVLLICCPIQSDNTSTELSKTVIELSTHPNAHLLTFEQCGRKTLDRIAFGTLTEPFEFPWMAILQTIISDQIKPFCGGSIISSRYILTAAHCLRTLLGDINIHSVVVGEHDTDTNPDCIDNFDCAEPIQEIPVEHSISHPNFRISDAQNDIGLVRLQWSIRFSDSVMPICIPYTDNFATIRYNRLIITGWGHTEIGTASKVLLKTTLNVTSNSDCSSIYRRHLSRLQINENVLCALGEQTDTCTGDSGGPAVFMEDIPQLGPRVFQYGIVSTGARTCGKNNGVPGAYTRVTSYVQWILDNISS